MKAAVQWIDFTTSQTPDAGGNAVVFCPQQAADGKILIVERVACICDDGTGLALGSALQWTLYVERQGSPRIDQSSNERDAFGPSPAGAFDMNNAMRVFNGARVAIRGEGLAATDVIYVTWQGFYVDEDAFTSVQGLATIEG